MSKTRVELWPEVYQVLKVTSCYTVNETLIGYLYNYMIGTASLIDIFTIFYNIPVV